MATQEVHELKQIPIGIDVTGKRKEIRFDGRDRGSRRTITGALRRSVP
jgi:hypothetical protein